MGHSRWESYVSHLCVEHWSLDPRELLKLMADIESLVVTGQVTRLSISTVLRMAGIPRDEAEAAAPGICAAIGAHDHPSAPPPM
ncbi:MAG: hypothetical protein PVJ80_17230 [Gemmatimonadota bacterium]|jgi:hypothetical protein